MENYRIICPISEVLLPKGPVSKALLKSCKNITSLFSVVLIFAFYNKSLMQTLTFVL